MNRRPVPRLHLIGPLDVDPSGYPRIAEEAVRGGCDAVHVRIPGGATDDILGLARAIRRSADGAAVIVNDRVDVALVAEADGVQLGERGFSVDDARHLLPAAMWIGRSVHDVAGARAAAGAGANYLMAGHIFDTPSKAGRPGRGLDWLAELVAAVNIPVIALGGITADRIPGVLATGAHGVALGRELLLADDPATSAHEATLHMRRADAPSGRGRRDGD